METLLAGLGAEIRETLHSLMGMLELVREEPLTENQSQCLARCQAGADHLMSSANDVLELARIEPPPYASDPLELEHTVEEIASVMQLLAESRGQELAWSFGSNLPAVIEGDRRLLQDTWRRLLASSLERAPGGRVDLSVRAVDGQTLAFEAVASPVENPGPEGLDFSLALRLVRKRLGRLGGSLTVETEPGRVITRMQLPFKTAQAQPGEKSPQKRAAEGSQNPIAPLNLLVAEDSDDSFYLLQAYVGSQGHKLARALDGAQAVEMAKTGLYDFVFMDVKMPAMDGYTASRLIREWETGQGRPRLPILLLSADEAARQMRLGADVGCSGYLAKPATRAQVLAALDFYARPRLEPSSK